MFYRYPTSRDDGSTRRLLVAGVVALVVHVGLVTLAAPRLVSADVQPLPAFDAGRVMSMTLVRETAPESPEEPHQFVALAAPEREERPDDARFLDRFERRVEQETVNSEDELTPVAPDTVANAAPVPRRTQAAMRPSDRERSNPRERVAAPAPVDERGAAPSPAVDPVEGAGEDDEAQPSTNGPVNRSLTLADFVPTYVEQADPVVAAASSRRNDYLDLAEGDRTELNSLRSMYWSFFNRMQERLSDEWNPNAVLNRHDPSGQLYGRSDRYTVLTVTLDADGGLRHALVTRSSQLDFLDDEAIRAFQVSAPFPNVPEGLKDENGQVTFDFGFHVSFERGTTRIRRISD